MPVVRRIGVGPDLRAIATTTGGGGGTAFDVAAPIGGTYTVRLGDSAALIAKKFTGNDRRYPELFPANPSKKLVDVYRIDNWPFDTKYVSVSEGSPAPDRGTFLGKNFATLNVGEVLTLPSAWSSSTTSPPPIGGGGPPSTSTDLPAGAIPTGGAAPRANDGTAYEKPTSPPDCSQMPAWIFPAEAAGFVTDWGSCLPKGLPIPTGGTGLPPLPPIGTGGTPGTPPIGLPGTLPEPPTSAPPQPQASSFPWVPVLVGVGAVGAIGGLAWYANSEEKKGARNGRRYA